MCTKHGASSNLRSFVERGLVFVESLPWFDITRSYEIKNKVCYLLLEPKVRNVRTIWERKNSRTFHRSHKNSARTCIFPQDTIWLNSNLFIALFRISEFCGNRCSERQSFRKETNEISQIYLHNFRLIFYTENLYVKLLNACKFHEI
jgi:hypothetical protein